MSSRYREGSARFNVQMDESLIAWLDQEAASRDRSRNWLIVEACEAFKRRVERAREKTAQRAKEALEGLKQGSQRSKRG